MGHSLPVSALDFMSYILCLSYCSTGAACSKQQQRLSTPCRPASEPLRECRPVLLLEQVQRGQGEAEREKQRKSRAGYLPSMRVDLGLMSRAIPQTKTNI